MDILQTANSLWLRMESFFRVVGWGTFVFVFTVVFLTFLFLISFNHTNIPVPFARFSSFVLIPLLFTLAKDNNKGLFDSKRNMGIWFVYSLVGVSVKIYKYDIFVKHGTQNSNRPGWLFEVENRFK